MPLIQLHLTRLANALLIVACSVWLLGTHAKAAEFTNKIQDEALSALENGEKFEILSLEPGTHWQSNVRFHGYKVLGQTTVTNAQTRAELVAALKKGVEENKGMAANCFQPRHGIRVSYNGLRFDFVICFQCLQVLLYAEDKKPQGFDTMGSPEPVFDKVLHAAGILLAPKE